MQPENRKCENCGRKMLRAAYIPFNDGMIVCFPCYDEWEKLGKPKSIADYHKAIYKRVEYETNLTSKK